MKKTEPSKEEKALFKMFREIFGIYKRGETLFVPEGISETTMKLIKEVAKRAKLKLKVKEHKPKEKWTK